MLSYCRVNDIQISSFAIAAELGRCAINLGMVASNKLADTVKTVEENCDRLKAIVDSPLTRSGVDCFCPRSYYNLGND